jgi:polyphenol oxidase
MQLNFLSNIQILEFDILKKYKNVVQFVTTRNGADLNDYFGGYNMSLMVNDSEEQITQNRQNLAVALQVSPNNLYIPVQTHSEHIVTITEENFSESLEDTDALCTNVKNICIATLAADCVPIILYDPINHCAATIHAGWKGTKKRILQKTIQQMSALYNTSSTDLIVCIGPSISDSVYEVGNEVAEEFSYLNISERTLVIKEHVNPEKKYLNIQQANIQQALEVGVLSSNIENAEICTFQNPELLYSARYFKNKCGRFATGIVLK